MKDPGPIIAGSEDHKLVYEFAQGIAKRFEIAEPAALGQVLKFYQALRKVTETEIGMASLKIEVKDNV